jgi:hypothetical protein
MTISLTPMSIIQVKEINTFPPPTVPEKSDLSVSPISDRELTESITSPNTDSSERARKRVKSELEDEENQTSERIDYYAGEDNKESLIVWPLASPAPHRDAHPLVPGLNLSFLHPEKQTLNAEQVNEKRAKWSHEKQRGRVLLEVSKTLPKDTLPIKRTSSTDILPVHKDVQDGLTRPKDLLPLAKTTFRNSQSSDPVARSRPRVQLPKIQFFNQSLFDGNRSEEVSSGSGMTTFVEEKSKCIESPPISMSQISGNYVFQPHTIPRPVLGDGSLEALKSRLRSRTTSFSMCKHISNFASGSTTSTTMRSKERMSPVKITMGLVKTRKLDGTLQINDYQLIKEVGSGAFGRVYEAKRGEVVYAIKEYNKQKLKHVLIGKKKTALDSIHEEIAILSRLEHPNVAYLYEVIDSPDSRKTYLVMEYAGKGRLQDYLPLGESQAQEYFLQIVEAVEYLHEVVQVIHRDIKPENVLLDSSGTIKVSDFGSAQTIINPDDTFSNTPGTPAFLSPEQCGGTKEFLGKPLDIWALGITLYYMLFNRPPFVARRLGDLYQSIKSEALSIPGDISPELRDLFDRLLEKNPSKRITLPEIREHPWTQANFFLSQSTPGH